MEKMISSIIKDVLLRGRFAARRIGLPGWQIHQICLQEKRLIYIPIPKNACTTIKQALHQVEFGRVFATERSINDPYVDVHDYYKKRRDAFTGIKKLDEKSGFTRFAIIRDPVERLISCYRNRVLDLGDLKSDADSLKRMNLPANPDLETFVLNLKRYRQVSKSIEHHSRPQSLFLGGTLEYLDHVYPIERVFELHDLLRTFSPGLNMLNRKSGGIKMDVSDLSQKVLSEANQFYKKDYQLLKEFYSPS